MANSYQNFTNPTIVPDEKYGFQALNDSLSQGLGKVSDLAIQQQLMKQKMQQDMATEAGKAQIQAWLNTQDPIARAMTMGKLGQMGANLGDIYPTQASGLAQILQGNPYANTVFPNGVPQGNNPQQGQQMQQGGQGMPQGMPQLGGGMSMNPIMQSQGGGQPYAGMPQNLVQDKVKMGPFGNPMPAEYTNVTAENTIAGNKSYADQIGQAKGKQAIATSQLDNITKNLAADLKAHFIEAQGGGPVKGRIAGWSTYLGMSPATFGLKNTVRDSAIAYARDLAGGSQGVQRLFSAITETIPNAGSTPEQAGTALLQMHLTAAQLQSGVDNLGLQPKDLSNMTDDEIRNVLAHGTIDRQKVTSDFANIMKDIQPTQVMGMNGQLNQPQVNPILNAASKFTNRGKQPTAQPQTPAISPTAQTKSQPPQEGKIYVDANGNKAKFSNGKYVEIP